MESLVNKYTKGSSAMYQPALPNFGMKDSRKSLRDQKAGSSSKSKERKQRTDSKERRLTEIDKIGLEVDRQLKQQRKAEKENIRKFGNPISQ